MDRSIIDYLRMSGQISQKDLDCLTFEIQKRLFFYGEHFKHPSEGNASGEMLKVQFRKLKRIKEAYKLAHIKGPAVVSNSYFAVNSVLAANGYQIISSLFEDVDLSLKVSSCDFLDLISRSTLEKISKEKERLSRIFDNEKIKGLVTPFDIPFIENITIDVFKGLRKPTFIYLHGLPAIYNNIDNNRADYLLVWGERIKEHCCQIGFRPDKILVVGHPWYGKFTKKDLRNSLENVLVLSKACSGTKLNDRAMSLYYLYMIKDVLIKAGVRSVKVRLHPSENIRWYEKYLDKNFFKFDLSPLKESLSSSSLVIGPASTVMLESIYYGTNYLIFEPSSGNKDVFGEYIFPPFDGSEKKLPTAKCEEDLLAMIKSGTKCDPSIFPEFIDPEFKINKVTEILGR